MRQGLAALIAHPRREYVTLSPPSGHFYVLRSGREKCSACFEWEGRGGHCGWRAAPGGAPVICVLTQGPELLGEELPEEVTPS